MHRILAKPLHCLLHRLGQGHGIASVEGDDAYLRIRERSATLNSLVGEHIHDAADLADLLGTAAHNDGVLDAVSLKIGVSRFGVAIAVDLAEGIDHSTGIAAIQRQLYRSTRRL